MAIALSTLSNVRYQFDINKLNLSLVVIESDIYNYEKIKENFVKCSLNWFGVFLYNQQI